MLQVLKHATTEVFIAETFIGRNVYDDVECVVECVINLNLLKTGDCCSKVHTAITYSYGDVASQDFLKI